MLGGLAPIIIFNFPIRMKNSLLFASEGVPTEEPTFLDKIGIPLPVYLDEKVTGVYVQNETKAIDIDTENYAKQDGSGEMMTIQKALNNTVTINMVAKKNSIVLGVLLALNDIVFTKVASKEYGVTYLNGPTTVFGGLLTGFTTQTSDDDDLMRIALTIWKTAQLSIVPGNVIPVPKVTGTTPLAG